MMVISFSEQQDTLSIEKAPGWSEGGGGVGGGGGGGGART